ncbi:MAG: hypothetical protein KF682_11925 [Nitrospira sp.]|nr:hypothetical protein [Nitrospira sp.]
MRQVDFYFHDGCLSQQSLLLLAREVETAYPTWTVTVHRLSDHEVNSMDLPILPTIVINGRPAGTGVPNKEWLLRKVAECVSSDL